MVGFVTRVLGVVVVGLGLAGCITSDQDIGREIPSVYPLAEGNYELLKRMTEQPNEVMTIKREGDGYFIAKSDGMEWEPIWFYKPKHLPPDRYIIKAMGPEPSQGETQEYCYVFGTVIDDSLTVFELNQSKIDAVAPPEIKDMLAKFNNKQGRVLDVLVALANMEGVWGAAETYRYVPSQAEMPE